MSSYEKILVDLIHDLRQPLGNLEITAWCLDRAVDPHNTRVQEHIVRMQQQLQQAENLLAAVAGEVEQRRRERLQPAAAYEYAAAAASH